MILPLYMAAVLMVCYIWCFTIWYDSCTDGVVYDFTIIYGSCTDGVVYLLFYHYILQQNHILYCMHISRLLIQCHWSIRKWYCSLVFRSSTFVSIPHLVAPLPSSNGWYSVLLYWYRLNFFHFFIHLTYYQCCEQGFGRLSFKQSEFSRFCLSLILVWISKSVLSYVCLFLCKTKLRTLTEWTVSGSDAYIIRNANF
jgi:hypothetical protein